MFGFIDRNDQEIWPPRDSSADVSARVSSSHGQSEGKRRATGARNITTQISLRCEITFDNKPFPSCFEPRCESEAKSKVFILKISFHSYGKKTNSHMKSYALDIAFITRFEATRKWLIQLIKPKISFHSHSRTHHHPYCMMELS